MFFDPPVSACPILSDPPFVFIMFLLATGMGYRLLRILKVPLESTFALEQGLFSALLGLGLLSMIPFSLGMLGRLTPRNIAIGLIVLLILFAWDIFRVSQGIMRAFKRNLRRRKLSWLFVAMMLTLLPPLAITFLQALTPPTDFDGLAYHLTAPKLWLGSHSLHYLPTMVHTNSPMGVEMLFTIPLALCSDTAAKLTHYGLGLLALTATFALGRRLHSTTAGILAVNLLLLCTPSVAQQFGKALVDLGLIFAITTALIGWVIWHRSKDNRWLIATALCLGIAVSFKFTGILYSVLIVAIVIRELRQNDQSWLCSQITTMRFIGISLLPVFPWFLRSILLTGNPIWPLLSLIFPSRDWDPVAESFYSHWFRYYNWDWGAIHSWEMRERLILLVSAIILISVMSIFIIRRLQARETGLLLTALSGVIILSMLETGLYFRFFLPAIPALYCIALSVLRLYEDKSIQRTMLLATIYAIFFGLSIWWIARECRPIGSPDQEAFRVTVLGQFPPVNEAFSAAVGQLSRGQYLSRYDQHYGFWRFANAHVPADEPILLMRGLPYYFHSRCYHTFPLFQRCFRFDDRQHLTDDLKNYQVNYIVIPNENIIKPSYGPDYLPLRNENPYMQWVARDYGILLYHDSGLSLYRIKFFR